jgi:type I restriction enzyme, S subunit
MKENAVALPEAWRMVVLGAYCDRGSLNGIKVKQLDYLPLGKFPVVDQGQENIGGYYGDPSLVVLSEPHISFWAITQSQEVHQFQFYWWGRWGKGVETQS